MQKDKWENEYQIKKDLPSSRTFFPSKAVVWFAENYIKVNASRGRALDLGSGNGRNSIYLAKLGYIVYGIEMVEYAVNLAREKAKVEKLLDKVNFEVGNVGERLGFEDESFDLIIDMMTLHLLNKSERLIYSGEVQRLLKPNGFYLLHTIYSESPAAVDLFKRYPGPELNSYIIPQSGVIEKAFSKDDLKTMFSSFNTIDLLEETQFTPAFGDVYERVYLRSLFQK